LSIGRLMNLFATRLREGIRDESAATAVEYGIMVALIAAVIIAAVTAFGQSVNNLFCWPIDVLMGEDPPEWCADVLAERGL
jgi:pilus assembly protein Flp/PilA